MITFNLSSNPPFLATVLGVAAVSVMATAVLLTADRTPEPVVYQTSTRTDGCVMFCDSPPPADFRDFDCVMFCHDAPQPPVKTDRCLMFCDEPRRGDR